MLKHHKRAPFQNKLEAIGSGPTERITRMDNRKHIGMDVHQASISIAVRGTAGKLVMECVVETKAASILEFIQGLPGSLRVTFEEGTSAAWRYDCGGRASGRAQLAPAIPSPSMPSPTVRSGRTALSASSAD
jgi:hypothetical protein